MAAKSTKAPTTTERRANRTQEDWDKLVPTIVKALQSGTTMTDIRAQYGAGPTIRRALWRNGFDTKGNSIKLTALKGSKPSVLAKRVAERRNQGASWIRLSLETGKDADELRTLLRAHGHDTLTEGRVVISERGKAKVAKAEAEAKAAEARKATRKPRARKAKVTA